MKLRRPRGDRGAYAAVEMALVLAIVVLPTVMVVVQIPTWIEGTSVANLAAQEAAREMALADNYGEGAIDGRRIAEQIVRNHGFSGDDLIAVAFSLDPSRPPATLTRGRSVVASVTVAVEGVFVPGAGTIGSFNVTRSATERIDDYRSFP